MSKPKRDIYAILWALEKSKAIPEMVEEHRFHPIRRWRFDYAIPSLKVAIEYEGIISSKSRHTSITGYTKDTEKYNEAAKMGWKVLRYTALNYKDLHRDLEYILKNEQTEKIQEGKR